MYNLIANIYQSRYKVLIIRTTKITHTRSCVSESPEANNIRGESGMPSANESAAHSTDTLK